jgi:hypothetical protein
LHDGRILVLLTQLTIPFSQTFISVEKESILITKQVNLLGIYMVFQRRVRKRGK